MSEWKSGDEIKLGDIVYLKSGSPPLTVERMLVEGIGDPLYVELVWFKGDDICRDVIPAYSLSKHSGKLDNDLIDPIIVLP